jgi:hypothetical protein
LNFLHLKNGIIKAASQKHPCAGAFAVYLSNFILEGSVSLAKIKAVTADFEEEQFEFKAVLIIHLDNGGSLFLTLESKVNDPAFQVLRDHERLFNVKTDGNSIYWPDGPQLTFNEIIEMLRADA